MTEEQEKELKQKKMKALGEYIASLRKEKGLSVRQLAEKIRVSDPYLYQVESGKKALTDPVYFNRLAEFFEINVAELLQRAGYLPATDEEKRIEDAIKKIVTDKSLEFGTRLSGKLETKEKKAIIQLYERAKGKKLL